jgi:hypothetical protein
MPNPSTQTRFRFHRVTPTRLFIAVVLALGTSVAAQAYDPGDTLEVREGDVWSPATLVRQEGRRLLVRYEDGTEEWVGNDRLRPADQEQTADDVEPTPRERPRTFRRGQTVELKDGRRWKPAQVKQVAPPLYLVATDDAFGRQEFHWAWVDAPRLRNPGEDFEGADAFSQFEEKVLNDTIRQSQRRATAAYEDHQKKQQQTARDEETGERDPFAPPPFDHPVSEPDTGEMKDLRLIDAGWDQVRVDPAPAGRVRTLSIDSQLPAGSFFARPERVATAGGSALLVIKDEPPGGAQTLLIERFDLDRGRSAAAMEVDAASLPMALSPDGRGVVGRSNGFHLGSKHRLDFWHWAGRELEHRRSFVPKPEGNFGNRSADIAAAAFAGPSLVVVETGYGSGRELSAWTYPEGVGRWRMIEPGRGIDAWAVSPGGNAVAVAAGGRLGLVDSESGHTALTLPGLHFDPKQLAFSPDGRYLAAAGPDRVKLWNLADRRALPSVAVAPAAGGRGSTLIVSDAGVLHWQRRLLDAARGAVRPAVVAQGSGPSAANAGRWTRAAAEGAREKQMSLHVWAIDEVTAAAAAEASPTRLLPPGTAVRLDTSGLGGSAEVRERFNELLLQAVADRGLSVNPQAPLALIAQTTTQSREETYETDELFPDQRQQSQVQVKTQVTHLELRINDQPAWRVTAVAGSSGRVALQEGQSMQSAVDASLDEDAGVRALLAVLESAEPLPEVIPDPRPAPATPVCLEPGRVSR